MSTPLRTLGVIPARAQSSRFPLKVIAPILGKPMVQYIWERSQQASKLNQVIVAVDSREVMASVQAFGAQVLMTPPELPSGSDRVAHVAMELDVDIVINLQADEPLLSAQAIDQLISKLEQDPTLDLATLVVPQSNPQTLNDVNVVKCVKSATDRALYFSRQPLKTSPEGGFLKHIGIYAYRKNALLKLSKLAPSLLERTEKLEQLRALENGMSIGVCLVTEDTIAVDVPEDIQKVERVLRAKGYEN